MSGPANVFSITKSAVGVTALYSSVTSSVVPPAVTATVSLTSWVGFAVSVVPIVTFSSVYPEISLIFSVTMISSPTVSPVNLSVYLFASVVSGVNASFIVSATAVADSLPSAARYFFVVLLYTLNVTPPLRSSSVSGPANVFSITKSAVSVAFFLYVSVRATVTSSLAFIAGDVTGYTVLAEESSTYSVSAVPSSASLISYVTSTGRFSIV